jgi:membrane protease YdiL (CAAX protease family)
MFTWLRRHPVFGGFALMFACTWPIDLWAAAASHGWTSVRIPPVLPVLVGYGFVVAAVVATAIVDGRYGVRTLLRRFLIWRAGLWWYGVILLGPAAVDLAAIALDAVLGGGAPDFAHPFATRIFPPELALWAAAPVFFMIQVLTNAEEIGWRGYALPRLQARHGALAATLVIGLVWAFWHVPKFLTAGSAQDYPFWLFLVDTTAKAVVFTWVFNSTGGSLLTVTLLHASLNTSAVFLPILPAATGDVRPTLIAIGLRCAAAVVIVLATGPARLSRTTQPQDWVKTVPRLSGPDETGGVRIRTTEEVRDDPDR